MSFGCWISSLVRISNHSICRPRRRRESPRIAIERLEPRVVPDNIAGDDLFTIDLLEVPVQFDWYVFSNDMIGPEPANADLIIIAVSGSTQGASISIGPDGTSLLYTPPVIAGTEISIGGEIPDTPPAEDGGGVLDTEDEWGFEPFRDQFTYTVQDTISGESAVGTVNVEGTLPGQWSVKLREDYNTAAEWGIDGQKGFDGTMEKIFGDDAGPGRGAYGKTGMQVWQTNFVTHHVYAATILGGNCETFHYENRLQVDTRDVEGEEFPLTINDQLAKIFPAAATVYFAWIVVDQTVGFNAPNKKMPAPPAVTNPWRPNAAQEAVFEQMAGPTHSMSSLYVYLNKNNINQAWVGGQMTNGQLGSLKNDMAAIGLPYANQPTKLERLQIGDLALWETTTP